MSVALATCEPKVCHSYARFCKRGHLRTEATTFARTVRKNGKEYIVRECRQCHSIRNTGDTKRKYSSKWMAKGAAL